MMTTKSWDTLNVTDYTSLQMLFLTLKITSFRATLYDLQKAQWDYPTINFRYIVFPTGSLPSTVAPYAFSQSQIDSMIKQGEADAIAAINAGVGAKWNEIVSEASTYIENTFGKGASLPDPVEHAQMVNMIKQAINEEQQKFSEEI